MPRNGNDTYHTLKIWLLRQKNYKEPITLYIIIKLGCTNPGPHVIAAIKFWLILRNLFLSTLLATGIFRWFFHFEKICAPLLTIRTYHWHKHEQFYSTSFSKAYLHIQTKLLDIISAQFDETYQLLIIYLTFIKYLRRQGDTTKLYIKLWTRRELSVWGPGS